MIRKRKFFTLILLCLFSALLALTLSACSAFDGPQGPKGEQGIQGEQGVNGANGAAWLVGVDAPSNDRGVDGDFYLNTATFDLYLKGAGAWSLVGNIKGNDAADKFAVLTFETSTKDVVCDPMIVEKGKNAQLPTPERLGYRFSGWYYNAGDFPRRVTEKTVIESSMALEAKWTAQLSLNHMTNANVDEVWEASLFYPLYDGETSAAPIAVNSIKFDGKEYGKTEALEERLILADFYILPEDEYDYDVEDWVDTGYYEVQGIFGKTGDYVIEFINYFGSTLEIELTVEPPLFDGELDVDLVYFGDNVDMIYTAGNTVSFLRDAVPSVDLSVDFRAPFGSIFSGTLNGEALECVFYTQISSVEYQADFVGEFDATLDTHVFEFTVTSEWYGSKTETLTVNIIDTPVENTILYHEWTKTVVSDDVEPAYFNEILTYYSVDGARPIVSSVLTNSDGETVATFIPGISVDGNLITYSSFVSIIDSEYPVGEYTVTTTLKSDETDQATDVLPAQVVNFYVAPTWEFAGDIPLMLVGKPVDLLFKLDDEVTSLQVFGQKITQGQVATAQYEAADFEVSFTVAEGKTTMTVKATAKMIIERPEKEMLFTTVTTENHSWEAVVYGCMAMEEEGLRASGLVYGGAIKYALETYFSNLITVEGPVKALYDAVNFDYENGEIWEILRSVDGENFKKLYQDAITALETEMEEGENIETYLKKIRENILSESYFSKQFLFELDGGFFDYYVFDDDWSNTYASLFEIAEGEFVYTYKNGRLIADLMYEDIVGMMREDLDYLPEEIARMVRDAIGAHDALAEAEANGETDVQDLVKDYVASMEILMSLMVGGGGIPIIMI